MKIIKESNINSKVVTNTNIMLDNGMTLSFTKGQILGSIRDSISVEEFERKFAEDDVGTIIGSTTLFDVDSINQTHFYGVFKEDAKNTMTVVNCFEEATHIIIMQDMKDESIAYLIRNVLGDSDNDGFVISVSYINGTVYVLKDL